MAGADAARDQDQGCRGEVRGPCACSKYVE